MIIVSAFADEASPTLAGQIEALGRNRIRRLELRNVSGKNIGELSLEEGRVISGQLKDAGILVPSVGSPIGKSDLSEDFSLCRARARHIFALAQLFGAEKVRIFSFYGAFSHREEVIERLHTLVEDAAEYSLTLCHENEKEIYGDTAERVLDLLNNVPGLKSVYDPANFLQVGERPQETLSLLHGRTDYFHIKDAVMATGELVPAGEGDGEILRLIEMIRRDTMLTVEPHLRLFAGYRSLDRSELKNKYVYRSADEAFDGAVCALKNILRAAGYRETEEGFVK